MKLVIKDGHWAHVYEMGDYLTIVVCYSFILLAFSSLVLLTKEAILFFMN